MTDLPEVLEGVQRCKAGLVELRRQHKVEELRVNQELGHNEQVERGLAAQEAKLELGEEEADLVVSLAGHLSRVEARQGEDGLEMQRVKEENEWLREELEEAERRLEEAVTRLAGLEVERSHWLFMEEMRKAEQDADSFKVTPSKIPVGSFRVEEERAINKALSRPSSPIGRRSPSPSPIPTVSRIPKFCPPPAYKSVQDKIDRANTLKKDHGRQLCRGRLQLSPSSSTSIPRVHVDSAR